MGDCGNPSLKHHIPYTAFDVMATSMTGLKYCFREVVPDTLKRDDVIVQRANDGSCKLSSVITPAFTITRPHLDGCGSGQILMVTYGCKIVFWWEMTEEMMGLFENLHCASRGEYTSIAISTWPNMKWAILRCGEYIEMSPGTVHAVVSPMNSAVSGWTYVQSEWFKDTDLLKTLMNWELNIVEERVNNPRHDHHDPQGIVSTIRGDVRLWEEWCERGSSNTMEKTELLRLKNEVKKRLSRIEDSIRKKRKREGKN